MNKEAEHQFGVWEGVDRRKLRCRFHINIFMYEVIKSYVLKMQQMVKILENGLKVIIKCANYKDEKILACYTQKWLKYAIDLELSTSEVQCCSQIPTTPTPVVLTTPCLGVVTGADMMGIGFYVWGRDRWLLFASIQVTESRLGESLELEFAAVTHVLCKCIPAEYIYINLN